MGWMDTVVSIPAGSWINDLPEDGASPLITSPWRPGHKRITGTIRSLVALVLRNSVIDTALYTVEPWAIPNPWSDWQSHTASANTYPMDSGLYFVSDRLPHYNLGSGVLVDSTPCGFVLRVIPTSATPTISVAFNTGPDWDPVIPASSGPLVLVYEMLPGQLSATVTASGCSTFQNYIYWPPGVIVDPNPAHWLTGYTQRQSLQVSCPPLPTSHGTYDPSVWAPIDNTLAASNSFSAVYRGLVQDNGGKAMPGAGYYYSFNGSWQFDEYVIPTAAGLVRQSCGFDHVESPYSTSSNARIPGVLDYGTPSLTRTVVLSSPYALQVHVASTITVGYSISVYEAAITDLSASPGTSIGTYSVPASTSPGTTLSFQLPASVSEQTNERRRYAVVINSGSGGALTFAFQPSVNHALPFSVVASDGVVIPAGEDTDFQYDITAWPTESETVGTPTPANLSQGYYRWSSLSAGIYQITAPEANITLSDGIGRITNATAMAIPSGGSVEALCHGQKLWRPAATGKLDIMTVSPQTLALGDNSTPWVAATYGVGKFTAPSTGRYRISLRGKPIMALLVGLDQAVTAPHASIALLPARELRSAVTMPTMVALPPANTPPATVSYVGPRMYAIGAAPTGAWAGHAGDLAVGVVAPGTVEWEFIRPSIGMIIGNWRWNGSSWTDHSSVELGHADIDLANGQSVYARFTYAIPSSDADLPDGPLGYVLASGIASGSTITITVI